MIKPHVRVTMLTGGTMANEEREAPHDRQRAPRSGMDVAMAGRISENESNFPLGARPDEGVERIYLYIQLRGDLRMGGEQRSRDVRGNPAARGRRAVANR